MSPRHRDNSIPEVLEDTKGAVGQERSEQGEEMETRWSDQERGLKGLSTAIETSAAAKTAC